MLELVSRQSGPPADTDAQSSTNQRVWRSLRPVLIGLAPLILFVGAAAAQSSGPGTAFCNSDMASTIKNLFTVIQFGGPLVGGVIALGSMVATPFARRSDWKKEIKAMRDQALIWGLLVAPLGTQIVKFILNNIVAGGSSCGF